MNSKLLYFIGGLVVGSTASFFITKHFCDLEKEQEIKDVKKLYSNKPILKVLKKELTDTGFRFTAGNELSPEEAVKLNDKLKSDILENHDIVQKQNYNLFSKPPHARDIHNGIDEGEDLDVMYNDYPKEGMSDKPYIISSTQFVNEEPYFDKITLELYDDGILSNAISEEIIENVDSAVGNDTLVNFEEYAKDDVVYIRNERRSTDYEIIRQHRNFAIFDEDES